METKDFFDNMADKWDEMTCHDKTKLEKIIKISDIREKSKILDVGTGTGILIGYLLDTSPEEITAIDLSPKMISTAKKKYNNKNVRFIVGDILNFNERGYDYIFMYSVYPHIPDKNKLFKHLNTLLNTEGKIIIAHSQSREKINEMHMSNKYMSNDILPSAKETSLLMSSYFRIDKIIDNDEMYYVSGIK